MTNHPKESLLGRVERGARKSKLQSKRRSNDLTSSIDAETQRQNNMEDLNTDLALQLQGIPNRSSQATSRFADANPDDEMSIFGRQSNGSFGMSMEDQTSFYPNNAILSSFTGLDRSVPSAVGVDSSSGVADSTVTPVAASGLDTPPSWDPTAKLNEYYFSKRRMFGKTISFKESFVTWPKGPQNSLQWTSIFVCPDSGECLASGAMLHGTPPLRDPQEQGNWYLKKKCAVKAAAGRAVDCFRYRDPSNPTGAVSLYCMEAPYGKDLLLRRYLDIPFHVPAEHVLEIRQLQNAAIGGAFD